MDIVDQLWLESYLAYLDDSCEFGFVPVSFSDYKKSIDELIMREGDDDVE